MQNCYIVYSLSEPDSEGQMERQKILWGIILSAILLVSVGFYVSPRVSQTQGALAMNEPANLRDIVQVSSFFDVFLTDIIDPTLKSQGVTAIQGVPGVQEVITDLATKHPESFCGAATCNPVPDLSQLCAGYPCELSLARGNEPLGGPPLFDIQILDIQLAPDPNGIASWIFVLFYPTQPQYSMAIGVDGNLASTRQTPNVDPAIIVNAEPYWFLRWRWCTWTVAPYTTCHLVWWDYWWYDSHNHPNWFWGVYWWWRVYVKAYFGAFWHPVFWYWWHWVYWKHWYWWSTYFPY